MAAEQAHNTAVYMHIQTQFAPRKAGTIGYLHSLHLNGVKT